MLSGEGADIIVDSPAPLIQMIKASKMKPLAVTSSTRFAGLEDVPTLAETLPGFEASGWFGVFAPVRTQANVLEKVNADIQTVVQTPDARSRFAELGLYPLARGVRGSADYINADRERWAKLIRELGIKPE